MICKEEKFIGLRILEPLYWHPWPRPLLLHHNMADEEKQPCAEEIRHRLTGAPELTPQSRHLSLLKAMLQ